MKVPEEIFKLIERFKDNLEDYKSGRYNETQVRLEFIDPFFKALGWDVHNEKGYAEAYKDVIHEDAIKISGATKAPDYCFRIGGVRKFFLEAKKPSIDIKHDTHPAYQLRRYAWSAKLPLSILTDFEEFAVYDCRFKPVKTDKASTARILYLNFREYIDKWEEISSIFAREAVLKGSFDRYIESNKKKKGTAEVDSAFLKEIETWRENLAKNIALRNPKLSQRAINFAVQKTIDRIIFLRISEDRGLESYGTLREVGNGNNVYRRLCEIFLKADKRYNSGLFHFKREKGISTHPDELTLTIKIDDAPLKTIIKSLYYPDSPYEFSVLPSDILGQVYEQFLGKVIRLTSSHRAVVEEKPEVRKAGGVYYTPTYIVDYIVKNTVGKLVEGKTPKQVEKLKILDPACGSGSFLIGAYQYLLNWHRDWYVKHGPQKHKKVLYQATGGDWRLTTDEKKRILLNNIYGVDIDEQAVEVTKLALLLKVLEGETQLQLLHERILPNLGNNIKCGNSLIGPDFYENQPMDLFDEKEQYRINAFDWETEFPEIFSGKNPGFDAVIGNPPYFNISILDKKIFHYLESKYKKIHTGYNDIMYYFIYKGIELLNSYGVYGVITSNYYLGNSYAKLLRKYLKEHVSKIINFKDFLIFKDANIHTNIIIAHKNPNSNEIHFFEKADKQT
ncbi:MAG: N-6 DNA methylase, partial [Elusimicrobia bacterium]|nr:N-6 DNA methylase [Elusimicrobiota bacterium]